MPIVFLLNLQPVSDDRFFEYISKEEKIGVEEAVVLGYEVFNDTFDMKLATEKAVEFLEKNKGERRKEVFLCLTAGGVVPVSVEETLGKAVRSESTADVFENVERKVAVVVKRTETKNRLTDNSIQKVALQVFSNGNQIFSFYSRKIFIYEYGIVDVPILGLTSEGKLIATIVFSNTFSVKTNLYKNASITIIEYDIDTNRKKIRKMKCMFAKIEIEDGNVTIFCDDKKVTINFKRRKERKDDIYE